MPAPRVKLPVVLIGDVVIYFDKALPATAAAAASPWRGAIVPSVRALVRKVHVGEPGLLDLQLFTSADGNDVATGELKYRVPQQPIGMGQRSGTWQPVS